MTLTDIVKQFLCCPYDYSCLEVVWESPEQTGTLSCCQCQRSWPICHGIPVLMPDYFFKTCTASEENEESTDCLSEISMRDAQAQEYDRMLSRRRDSIEIPTTLNAFQIHQQDVVVEVGVGTGRALHYTHQCQLVIACDYSIASLRLLQQKGLTNLILIQADATFLPIRNTMIDAIISVGMFHHLPSQGTRRQHLKECKRILRAGGQYVMSGVYNFTFLNRLRDVKTVYTKNDLHPGAEGKTGYHSNNTIYYYNFDIRELRQEAELYFQVIEVFGFWVDLWIEYFGVLAKVIDRLIGAYRLDKIWHHTWFGDRFGKEIFMRMIKPG